MHFKNIAEEIEKFEEKNMDFLIHHSSYGWNSWYILKKPLYNFFRNKTIKKTSVTSSGENLTVNLVPTIISFLKLMFAIITKRNSVLLYSYSGYRSSVENATPKNPFLDYFVLNNPDQKFLYFESFGGLPKNRDVEVPSDFNIKHFKPLIGIIKLFLKKKKVLKSSSKEFAVRFNQYFLDSPMKVTDDLVLTALSSFLAEYWFYSYIFRWLKPRKIMMVDGVPTGFLAAAVRNNIPVYEFQHGLIGDNKFEYFVNPNFLKVANRIAYPQKIIVFGDYFREIVCKSGFWKSGDVVPVGHSAIELVRQKKGQAHIPISDKIKTLLFITQPSIHLLCLQFLESLSDKEISFKVLIKPHPAEGKENLNAYHHFASKHADVEVIDGSVSLYTSFLSSDAVIGYHSTSLLEAVAVGIPVFTISTEHFKMGINSYLENEISDVIKVVDTPDDLVNLVSKMGGEELSKWRNETEKIGRYFYKDDYLTNISSLL